MNYLSRSIFAVLLMMAKIQFTYAQDSTEDLIKQGIALQKQKKYAEAISQFKEVLKTDKENAYANYELAYALYLSKKGNDAIPNLLIAVKSPKATINVPAYSLLATIYDEGGQRTEAIAFYNQAVKLDPDYPQIYYNLGIVYFGNKQYAEAENAAIEAIKHDPKNSSSQRLYALVTFHQNKRANALLGLCSFLMLEPTGLRATEAYGNVQHILQGGVLKDANGNTVAGVSLKDDPEAGVLNTIISNAVQLAKAKGLVGSALLEAELKGIFMMVGQLTEKKTNKNFFDTYFASYFYKFAKSDNMPALSHTVALDAKWKQANTQRMAALTDWIRTNDR